MLVSSKQPLRTYGAPRAAAGIIDCHCHAGPGDGLTGPWDTDAPLGAYLRRADAAGIVRTVLFAAFHSDYAAFHSDYAVANREVARIVAHRPERFLGFAFVHPERDRGRVRLLVQVAVERYGFAGIKVHRHDARITREVCDAARAFRLPVLYDPMGEVSVADLLAEAYPDVPFIIPHLGSFADDWRAQRAFLDPLARHPNIHADSSGVRRFDLLEEAVRRAGAHKLLFGSDGPWLHPGLELAKIRALGLSPAEERQVLSENLLRLISSSGDAARRPRSALPPRDRRRGQGPSPDASGEGLEGRPGAARRNDGWGQAEVRDPWRAPEHQPA